MGSHVTVSVGTATEPQLLVRGTELVQVSSPVQSGHRVPDLLTRTGASSRVLACTYAGVLLRVSWPSRNCWRRCQRDFAHESCGMRRVLDFREVSWQIHSRARCRIKTKEYPLKCSGVVGRTEFCCSRRQESCFLPSIRFALTSMRPCQAAVLLSFWAKA